MLVILGLSTSIIAPSMFSILERIQKRGELNTIRQVVKSVKDKSFFSSKDYVITFKKHKFFVFSVLPISDEISLENISQECLLQIRDNKELTGNESEDAQGQFECEVLKTFESSYFTFSDVNFVISNGNYWKSVSLEIFEGDSKPFVVLKFND